MWYLFFKYHNGKTMFLSTCMDNSITLNMYTDACKKACAATFMKQWFVIDQSHVTAAIWWPLGVAVVSVTCMRVRWFSHTWKRMQWNIFLFESSHKSPYRTNSYQMGFGYEASLNFHTYFGQCPNDTYIFLHIPLHVCPNYPHTGLATATAPSSHQMAVIAWDRSIEFQVD